MLTIKSPIQLAINTSMIKQNDCMMERMEANYQVMASSLNPENMIHLMVGQQEFYVEGDSMTSLISMHSKINKQQINIGLINNVLNRLLVINNSDINYQDRVFVEMVLSRMGINDVKQFIQNINAVRQNVQNLNELTKLYNQGGELLQEIQLYKNEINRVKSAESDSEADVDKRVELWLHQKILNRLHTGEIYSEVQKFYTSIYDRKKQIDVRELQMSEQIAMSQNLFLNQLKNQVLSESNPLEYRVINLYEIGNKEQYDIHDEYIKSELLKAIILNAVNNTYALRFKEISEQAGTWYDMLESIHYAVENTLRRFENYHLNQEMSYQEADLYQYGVQKNTTNEIRALRQLYEVYESVISYRAENVQPENEEIIENNIDNQQINYLSKEEQSLKQQLQVINQTHVEKQEMLLQVIKNMKPELKMQIDQIKEMADAGKSLGNIIELLLEYTSTKTSTELYEKERKYELEKVFDKNVLEILEMVEKYHRNPESMSDNSSMNDTAEINALRQLYEAYEPVISYKAEAVPIENEEIIEKNIGNQQINYLSKEEQNLKQQLQVINQTNIEKQEKLQQVITNMKPEPKMQINRTKAMADVGKSLGNLNELVLKYTNTKTSMEHYERERKYELEKVFDKNVLEIFEMVEKYHRNPESMSDNISMNDTALELLMRDTNISVDVKENQVMQSIYKNIDMGIENKKKTEIKTQLERIIRNEPIITKEAEKNTDIELFHKVSENKVSEEMLEEIRNVNRSIKRDVTQYSEVLEDTREVYQTVSNHVNNIQLQQNEELSTIIASNVKEQLGDLSEQVYRKLEKRMDSERRRRGL